eukprot:Sspe_Gene.57863::Locus_31750_Transcript_1_1_Confidence_1.000_Length_924::g.57863::m.57863
MASGGTVKGRGVGQRGSAPPTAAAPQPQPQVQSEEGEGSQQGQDLQKLTSQEYLDKYSVTAYLKDVVTLLLENRPDSPVEFIADYFRNVIQGTSPMIRSYRYIKLTKRNRQAFWDNLVAAYATLDEKRGGGVGLTGADMYRLLQLLCSDFPSDIVSSVLAVLEKTEQCLVPFDQFAAGVHACLLYEEFFHMAEAVFATLDPLRKGVVKIQVLHDALAIGLADQEKKGVHGLPSWTELQEFFNSSMWQAKDEISFKQFIRHIFQLTSPVPLSSPYLVQKD